MSKQILRRALQREARSMGARKITYLDHKFMDHGLLVLHYYVDSHIVNLHKPQVLRSSRMAIFKGEDSLCSLITDSVWLDPPEET